VGTRSPSAWGLALARDIEPWLEGSVPRPREACGRCGLLALDLDTEGLERFFAPLDPP